MTRLPSPTAAATRFTELERTSPAANTPGAEVSNRKGGRVWRHFPEAAADPRQSVATSGPRARATRNRSGYAGESRTSYGPRVAIEDQPTEPL